MKTKSWARHIVSTFLILFLLFGASKAFQAIDEYRSITYDPQLWTFTAAALFFYGGLGVVLGSEHFLVERKKDGAWRANWPKLITMALPALFFSFTVVIYGYGGPFIGKMPKYLISYLANNSWPAVNFFPLVLGYTIATGFYKHDA